MTFTLCQFGFAFVGALNVDEPPLADSTSDLLLVLLLVVLVLASVVEVFV